MAGSRWPPSPAGPGSPARSRRWPARALLAAVAAWTAVAAARRYRSPAAIPRVGLALRTPLRAYTALAAITAVNPLTVIYWAALVLGRQASATAFTPAEAGAFVGAVVAASASWQLVLVSGGRLIGRLATSRRGMLAISLASSLPIPPRASPTPPAVARDGCDARTLSQ